MRIYFELLPFPPPSGRIFRSYNDEADDLDGNQDENTMDTERPHAGSSNQKSNAESDPRLSMGFKAKSVQTAAMQLTPEHSYLAADTLPKAQTESPDSEQKSQWEQLRKIAQDFTVHDGSKLLKELEMGTDSESDGDELMDDEDKSLLLTATKRNLLDDLDSCATPNDNMQFH